MKKTTKLIIGLIGLSIIGGVAYATVTTANTRYSAISKLPWNGSGWSTYDSAHDVGPAAAGDKARFNGTKGTDNVITDTRTGLMWESIPDSGSITKTWDAAKIHCAGLTKGGFSDWRLPNIRELMSIVDYSRTDGNNYWYESKFTLEADIYWSSTTFATDTYVARTLSFSSASTNTLSKPLDRRVICTR